MLVLHNLSTVFYKTFHYAVAQVRKKAGSTSLGFVKLILTTMAMFVFMMGLMMLIRMGGSFGVSIRGEFLLYVLSGVAMFMTHNKIFGAVADLYKPDAMLPVLSISRGIMIMGAILENLYMTFVVNFLFYIVICIIYGEIIMDNPFGFAYCYFVLVLWSVSLGLIFQAITPLAPSVFRILANFYKRIGIVTSGKMVPGNLLGAMGKFGGIFLWNPLFHIIDQGRGFIFDQYNPFISTLEYPIKASIIAFTFAIIFNFVSSRLK